MQDKLCSWCMHPMSWGQGSCKSTVGYTHFENPFDVQMHSECADVVRKRYEALTLRNLDYSMMRFGKSFISKKAKEARERYIEAQQRWRRWIDEELLELRGGTGQYSGPWFDDEA